MNYALFLGCLIPTREPSYELSVRAVMKQLDVSLVDLKETGCCAPIPVESLDFKTGLSIAAYELCLAEEAKLDYMTICNGCFESLKRADTLLKTNDYLRKEVNEVLEGVGKKFGGTREVRNYLQVLKEDVGLEKLRKSIVKPLDGLRVAVFYGCHALRPSTVLRLDDPERPRILDDLVGVTGAESVQYVKKMQCCGGLLRGVNDNIARNLARQKLQNISAAGAECIVTICPFCFLQLDTGQLEITRFYNEQYDVPVFHYPELLGLAMGLKPNDLGLQTHRVKADRILNKVQN